LNRASFRLDSVIVQFRKIKRVLRKFGTVLRFKIKVKDACSHALAESLTLSIDEHSINKRGVNPSTIR
jgi:hypothetical protein